MESEVKIMYEIEKTITDSNLPKELKDKALAEIKVLDKSPCNFSDNSNLLMAFIWRDTPSGHKFWHKINNLLFDEVNK